MNPPPAPDELEPQPGPEPEPQPDPFEPSPEEQDVIPLCEDCGGRLRPGRPPRLWRILGWWLVILAMVLLLAGAALSDDSCFAAAGVCLVAGFLLVRVRGRYHCLQCGRRYPFEPETWGQSVRPNADKAPDDDT
jgi:hypothetical protein